LTDQPAEPQQLDNQVKAGDTNPLGAAEQQLTEEEIIQKEKDTFIQKRKEARENQKRMEQLVLEKQAAIQKEIRERAEKQQKEKERQLRRLEEHLMKKEEENLRIKALNEEKVEKVVKPKKEPRKNRELEAFLREKREQLKQKHDTDQNIARDMQESFDTDDDVSFPVAYEGDFEGRNDGSIFTGDNEVVTEDSYSEGVRKTYEAGNAPVHGDESSISDETIHLSYTNELLPPPEHFSDETNKQPRSAFTKKTKSQVSKKVTFDEYDTEISFKSNDDFDKSKTLSNLLGTDFHAAVRELDLENLMSSSIPEFDYDKYYDEIAASLNNPIFSANSFNSLLSPSSFNSCMSSSCTSSEDEQDLPSIRYQGNINQGITKKSRAESSA